MDSKKDLRDKLIAKHLEGWNGLNTQSIDHFASSGKASGTFRTALHEMMEAYAGELPSIEEDVPLTETFAELRQLYNKR